MEPGKEAAMKEMGVAGREQIASLVASENLHLLSVCRSTAAMLYQRLYIGNMESVHCCILFSLLGICELCSYVCMYVCMYVYFGQFKMEALDVYPLQGSQSSMFALLRLSIKH